MSARSAYLCQIQGCNIALILLGLGSVGLAGSQFSKVRLDTYRDIDLRLLNWIHILAGGIGIYSIVRSHGYIVTKTLYCVSFVIGMASAVFYGFTTYRVVDAHNSLKSLKSVAGFQEDFGQEERNYAGRIAISAIMIGVPALASLIALVAIMLLEKLVIVTSPIYPLQSRDQEVAMDNARKALASVGIIKSFLGLGILGLAVFVEYEHEKVSVNGMYIKIALEHITAMLAIVSGIVDMITSRRRIQEQLNLKVALGLALIVAVWSIKTVDHNTMPFYKNDLKFYYQGRAMNDPSISSSTAPRYIIVVAHGVLIGCYGIMFLLCVISSVVIGTCLQLDILSINLEIEKGLAIQSRLLSVMHMAWGSCLMALCILGLLDLPWRGEFLGGDLLWMSLLFFVTGVVGGGNYGTMINARFVMNVISLGIAIEKMCASINLIYQFSSYDIYVRGENKTFVGQIVLISIQTGIFAAESLTALICVILFGKEVAQHPPNICRHSNGIQILFSLGILFYAVVITGCYVVFELGKWRYSEVPLEVPFFRLGNGPLALTVFIVQLCCSCYPRILVASSILQVIIGALSLFTLSPAITNVYYLQVLLANADDLYSTQQQVTIYQVAIILASAATLACIIATLSATLCSLQCSNILHNRSISPDSTVITPLGEEQFCSGTFRNPRQGYGTISNQQSPVPIQQMEEQSVYWSADENPFYYHTSKRFYGQPYRVESGFYGYAFANPNSGIHHHRRLQSSSVQTQIAHVFTESQ